MSIKLHHKAFTLVEIIIVMALIGLLALGGYSAVYRHYSTSVVDSELRGIVSNLQRARQRAIGNSTGADYSVKFLSTTYVLFPGSTYVAGGSTNEVYALDSTVIVSSTFTNNVITFKKYNGRLTGGGIVYLSAYGATSQIIINSLGIVEDVV